MTDPLCQSVHGEFFFPPSFSDERSAPESHYYEIAKMVCEQCPYQEPCAVMGEEEEFGVWGGWSPKDRKRGEFRRAKKILPLEHLDVLPPPSPNESVDIPSLRETLKSYTERRQKVSE